MSRVHVLHPGDVFCADRDDRFETLLGSCVSVLLTDPRRTVGAMCHVVHSRAPLRGGEKNTAYGDVALARMAGLMRAKGIEPRLCEGWIYGGGNMFPGLVGAAASAGNVGAANLNWALDRMDEWGVRVLGEELGGNVYRRISWTVGPDAPTVMAMPS